MAVAVQRKAKAALAASTSIGAAEGWAAPTAGNLLVASANSDATVTMTTAGFTAGPSVVDGNGAYMWYKVAAGTESTITVTPSASANTVLTVAEYSGLTATPFDAQNSSTIAGTGGAVTTAAAVTATAAGDLIVAAALLHGYSGAVPASPAWSNSFVNQLTADTGGLTTNNCCTFYAELLTAGAAGSYSTSASWTNNAGDRQHIILAFKASAGAPAARPPRPTVIRQAVGFASTW